MKLRIQDNSIRYRLSTNEVEKLVNGIKLEGAVDFVSASFKYILYIADHDELLFEDNTIALAVSRSKVDGWNRSDKVTISLEFVGQKDNILSILVEKDLKG